jgi:hypothetical protein
MVFIFQPFFNHRIENPIFMKKKLRGSVVCRVLFRQEMDTRMNLNFSLDRVGSEGLTLTLRIGPLLR